MQCPVCGHDSHRIPLPPRRSADVDIRRVNCPECNTWFYTHSRPEFIEVWNPETMKNDRVPIADIDRYRDYLLGRAPHPDARGRLWND